MAAVDLLNKEAWYRPTIRKIERAIKRLTFGLIGKIMGTEPLETPIPLSRVDRILFIRYDALGDMVLSTPIWRNLKLLKPELVVGVAGSRKNVDLLRSNTNVDSVYTLSQETNRGIWSEIKRAREIEWDMIVNLVYNDKTRASIIAWLIAPNAIRVTAVREPPELYRKLYSIVAKRPPLRPPTPMLEQALYTLTAGLGVEIPKTEWQPSLQLDPVIASNVKSTLEGKTQATNSKRLIVLNTSSAERFREWGYENSWDFSMRLAERDHEMLVIWTGSPESQQALSDFMAAHRHERILHFPTPSTQHLASLIRMSSLVVSPDTSVVHIASAENKPVLGFYMEDNEFLPYGIPNIVLKPAQDQPLKTIPVDAAFEAAIRLLDAK